MAATADCLTVSACRAQAWPSRGRRKEGDSVELHLRNASGPHRQGHDAQLPDSGQAVADDEPAVQRHTSCGCGIGPFPTVASEQSRRQFLRRSAAGLALPAALALAGYPQIAQAQDASATPEALAPLPEVAQGPAINEQGYATQVIGGGLHAVTDGVYQAMFLVTDQGVVVVDAPPTIGANLLRAITDVTDQPITHVIY